MIGRRKFLSQISSVATVAGLSPMISACCSLCPAKSKRPYKLGVADWTLGLRGTPEAIYKTKELGLDGIQLSMPFSPDSEEWGTPVKLAEIKAAMIRENIECASTSPVLNGHPFISTKNAVGFTLNSIKAAHYLGGKDILLPFYGKSDMQDKSTKRMKEECFKPLIEKLKKIAPLAERLGVAIGMENSLNAEDDLRIIDAVGSPAVKVYFDIMNFQYYGFDTVPEMKKLKGHISQIHLKAIGHKLDANQGMPRDMQACLDTIGEIGYDGWLVFETHGRIKPEVHGTLDEILKHNIVQVKTSSLWR